jgi:mannose-6-phosphate isomerase-like protein (cupin superfamily)
MKHNLENNFCNGIFYLNGNQEKTVEKPWNKHAKFEGVYMKNMVLGNETGGLFSLHLVKVEPGFEIGEHLHEGKAELHEVVEGAGKCIIDNKELAYYTGDFALVPADTLHRVIAGENGLLLIAKFVPALS